LQTSCRNGTIEAIRIASALAVIWFHIYSLPFKRISYSGLIVFVILTTYFSYRTQQATKHPTSGRYRKRITRLLIPWAAWFSIYFSAKVITEQDYIASIEHPINFLLSGPWIALWYLPFAAAASAVTVKLSSIRHITSHLYGFIATTILILCLASLLRQIDIPSPWSQWIHAAPAVFAGISLRLAEETPNPRRSVKATGIILFLASACMLNDLGIAIPYSIAILLTTIAILFPIKETRFSKALSPLCFGAYLTHGAIIALLLHVAFFHHDRYTLFIATAVLSFLLTYLGRFIPWFKLIT